MGDVLEARRREFGAFLRSRREKLTPAEIGLPSGARRRTPGLRREEVAIATGIGTTWYTWLEQGRDVKPSAEVLERLADTLKLSIPEKRHLYIIAGRPLPTCTVPVREAVSPRLLRLIDGEDKAKPLSDQQLSEHMAREGCPISRRTVAKYREELGIPSASGRKS